MDGVEKAIRAALEKGDATDRAFRERIYLSALSALERSIKAGDGLDPREAAQRRTNLKSRIIEIEREFLPAREAEPSQVQPPVVPAPEPAAARPAAQPAQAPDVSIGRDTGAPKAASSDFVAELRPGKTSEPVPSEPELVMTRRRRPFSWLLMTALVIAFIGIGGWWLVTSGVLFPKDDGSVPNPPPQLSEDEYQPRDGTAAPGQPQAPVDGEWLTIFTPSDPSTATAPGGTVVSVEEEGTTKFLRVQPNDSEAAVLFDIGQGILEQIAGKTVTFDVSAKSATGQSTQMSIRCNFAELGDCGRKRYDVEASPSEFLFEMNMPDGSPGSSGFLSVSPDIAKGEKAVDIYGVRVFMPRN